MSQYRPPWRRRQLLASSHMTANNALLSHPGNLPLENMTVDVRNRTVAFSPTLSVTIHPRCRVMYTAVDVHCHCPYVKTPSLPRIFSPQFSFYNYLAYCCCCCSCCCCCCVTWRYSNTVEWAVNVGESIVGASSDDEKTPFTNTLTQCDQYTWCRHICVNFIDNKILFSRINR